MNGASDPGGLRRPTTRTRPYDHANDPKRLQKMSQDDVDKKLSSRAKLLVHSFRGSWLLLLLVFFIHEAGYGRASRSDLQESLRHVVVTTEMPRFVLRGEAETVPWKETQLFYRQRNFQPAWLRDHWLGGRRVHSQAAALLSCLRDARQEGLNPAEYPAVDGDDDKKKEKP